MVLICRLCALHQEFLIPVLKDTDLKLKILHLLQINIVPEDGLPDSVCLSCQNNVTNMFNFYQQVHQAQQYLADQVQQNALAKKLSVPVNVIYDKKVVSRTQNSNVILQSEFNNEQETKKINQMCKKIKKVTRKDLTNIEILGIKVMEWHKDGSVSFPNEEVEGWSSYPWVCYMCNNQTKTPLELKQHLSSDHNQSVHYQCVDCPKVYTKLTPFAAHVRAHRQNLRFCCETCMKWFGTTTTLQEHRNTVHCDGPFGCSSCGKKFRVRSALETHLRTHLPAEVKNQYQCDHCPKKFATKPNLFAHRRIHLGMREFKCNQCGKSFIQKGNLDTHLLTHGSARNFECSLCKKTFKTAVRLKRHSLIHTGMKPHRCEDCGRQFREKSTLREHMRIHTGAMPFSCEFCGKSFRFKGVLTTHRRQHTGERPYSCYECQHHFTNWPNYNKHMKRRHGIDTGSAKFKQNVSSNTTDKNLVGTVVTNTQSTKTPTETDLPKIDETPQRNLSEENPSQQYYSTTVINLYNLHNQMIQERLN